MNSLARGWHRGGAPSLPEMLQCRGAAGLSGEALARSHAVSSGQDLREPCALLGEKTKHEADFYPKCKQKCRPREMNPGF